MTYAGDDLASTCLEFMVAVAVMETPRQVVVQRGFVRDVQHVEREDGAVWTP